QEAVHRALLNLRPGLPARHGRLANPQQLGELLLRQPELFPALANLLRRQQPRFAPEGGTDLPVGLFVEAQRLTVTTARHREIGNFYPVRAAVVFDGGWQDWG